MRGSGIGKRVLQPGLNGSIRNQIVPLVLIALLIAAAAAAIDLLRAETFIGILAALGFGLCVVPILGRVAREEGEPRMATVLVAALLAKYVFTLARYFTIMVIYDGSGDAGLYHDIAVLLSDSYRRGVFIFELPGYNRGPETIRIAAILGFFYAIFGISRYAGFFFFTTICFGGQVLMWRALRRAVPEADSFRYALMVFFWPSLLFWPSSIGKDALMVGAIGVASYGAAILLSGRASGRGIVYFAAGALCLFVVRPHMAMIAIVALAFAAMTGTVTGIKGKGSSRAVVLRLVAVLAVLAVASSATGRLFATLNPDADEQGVSSVLERTSEQSSIGGSKFAPPSVSSPIEFPWAAITVLLRPFPWEAHNFNTFLASAEGLGMLLLIVLSRRRILTWIKMLPSTPYLAYCAVFTLVFIVAFSYIGNFGILARQRPQMLPLLMTMFAMQPAKRVRHRPGQEMGRTPETLVDRVRRGVLRPHEEPINSARRHELTRLEFINVSKVQGVARRRWRIVAAATLIGAVAGVITTNRSVERQSKIEYRAIQVLVPKVNNTPGLKTVMLQDKQRIRRGDIPEKVAARLGTPEAADSLANSIVVWVDPTNPQMWISSVDADPTVAEARVDAFVQVFMADLAARSRRDLNSELFAAQERERDAAAALDEFDLKYPDLLTNPDRYESITKVQELSFERRGLRATAVQTERAVRAVQLELETSVPYDALGPEPAVGVEVGRAAVPARYGTRVPLMAALGALLGITAAMLLERTRRVIDSRHDFVMGVDIPILAEVGYSPTISATDRTGRRLELREFYGEAFRRLRNEMFSGFGDHEPGDVVSREVPTEGAPRVSIFVSGSPGEGTSTAATLSALAMAETGQPTLIIDASYRHPSIARLVGSPSSPSLEDAAEQASVSDLWEHVAASEVDNLWVVPAGIASMEHRGRIRAAEALAEVARDHGLWVIIDCGPLAVSSDLVSLTVVADQVIIVSRSGMGHVATINEIVTAVRQHHHVDVGALFVGDRRIGRSQAVVFERNSPPAVLRPSRRAITPESVEV